MPPPSRTAPEPVPRPAPAPLPAPDGHRARRAVARAAVRLEVAVAGSAGSGWGSAAAPRAGVLFDAALAAFAAVVRAAGAAAPWTGAVRLLLGIRAADPSLVAVSRPAVPVAVLAVAGPVVREPELALPVARLAAVVAGPAVRVSGLAVSVAELAVVAGLVVPAPE